MTLRAALLNGVAVAVDAPALPLTERGFHYGDGLFETMLLVDGRVRFVADHWARLAEGAARLRISLPTAECWQAELSQLIGAHRTGVIKFVLTRGLSARGYRPVGAAPTRYWQLSDPPPPPASDGITVRWCDLRLARSAHLAGIKHCNRLEQVLAQDEWHDPAIAEGLMLDTEGELVCGTMSNVFLFIDDHWVTPDLRYSGVCGVIRRQVLRRLAAQGVPCEQRAVRADEVSQAQEVFVCNAVRGIQPVIRLAEQVWPIGSNTAALRSALGDRS